MAAIGVLVVVSLASTPHVPALACSKWDIGWCRSVTGRVVSAQRMDGDGDGDLHLVLMSHDSVSAPGVSIVKVRAENRPSRMPRFGQWVSAIGFPQYGASGLAEVDARRMRVK